MRKNKGIKSPGKMTRNEILLTYGNNILESRYFSAAEKQTHHVRSDVASHSINTALFCIRFYTLFRFMHVRVSLNTLVTAALVHDFGILGRDEKFSSNRECAFRHPKDSVTIIREMIPDVDYRVCDAVETHMFPLCKGIPHTREAWLLSMADKCAAVTDQFHHYSRAELALL